MALDDIVNVVITTQTVPISQVGFGTPLIMSYHTHFATRAKEYSASTALADMVTDGFATSDPAYLAAQAILSQNPRPNKIILGRETGTAKKKLKITPTTPENSTDYIVHVNGKEAKFTSDATATVPEIVVGLKTAIDALSENVTVTANGGAGTETDFDIEANTVADWFTFKIQLRRLLTRNDDTPDGSPTFATDLAAVINENNDWYSLHLTNHSHALIAAAAAEIEALKKTLVVSSGDDDIPTAATDDIASTLATAAYARTALIFHPEPYKFAGAAWAGKLLPKDPGSVTWKFKTLAGIPVYTLSGAEEGYLRGKYCNYYTSISGVSITQDGWTSAAEFIDITRGSDWFRVRLQERIFVRLASQDKIPYTDLGTGVPEGELRAQFREAIGVNFVAAFPAPTVTVPLVADISIADRAARYLPDIKGEGTLAGAIHSLKLSVVLSV